MNKRKPFIMQYVIGAHFTNICVYLISSFLHNIISLRCCVTNMAPDYYSILFPDISLYMMFDSLRVPSYVILRSSLIVPKSRIYLSPHVILARNNASSHRSRALAPTTKVYDAVCECSFLSICSKVRGIRKREPATS